MTTQLAPLSQARQALVLGVMRLIEKKVNELAPWAVDDERADFVGAARLGATIAAARWSSSHGSRFTSYATPFICGAILDHITAESRQRTLFRAGREFMADQSDTFKVIWDDAETNRARLETLAERLFAAMFAGVAGAALANPEEVVLEVGGHERAVEIVKAAVEGSPELERNLFTQRYEEGRTLVSIAEALGVDESTVRRHHESLLDRITALLYEGGITELPFCS